MAPKVVGHWMPSLPIALDDVDPTGNPGDYYKRNYLTTSGEGGIHAAYGGFLRDAPAIRTDVARPIGGDYVLSDMRIEVARARAAGLDYIGPDLLNLSGSANHTRTQKLMQAADEDGVLKVFLIPDLTSPSVWNLTQDQFAAAIADLAAHPSVGKLPDGRLIIAPFCGTYTTTGTQPSKTPTWWSQVNAKITTLTGLTVCFLPIYNSLPTAVFDAFDSVCDGYGSWGNRNPGASAGVGTLAATMRARPGNASKIWVAPVSWMDSRPQQRIFDENNGSEQLRLSWAQAIASCTGPNDFVQLITLNDYVECSYFSLSRRNGWTPYKISQFYAYKLKNGAFPTPTVDSVNIIHRKQIASPTYVLSAARNAGTAYTSLTVNALGADRPVAGDKLHFIDGQVVTVASSPANGATSITINSWTPTTTLASGSPVVKKTWTFAPPSGNYQPMANRRFRGSVSSTDTVNIVEVLTYLTAPADVVATIGGVAQTSYSAPAGEYVKTFPAAVGAAPSVAITRSGSPILSVVSPEGITATPYVQDMSYVTAYAENPPIVVPSDPDPTAVRIRQAGDTATALTAANPVLKRDEVVWERVGTAPATKFKVGDGVTPWNSLPYFATGGGSVTPNVQSFTADGTWTKPSGSYTWADITVQAPGGGGASGRRGAAGTARVGGGGGGGGGRCVRRVPFSELATTEAVVLPSPGNGGAAVTADSTNGNNGSAVASATTFGDWARAGVANGGAGGLDGAGGTAGGGGTGQFTGGNGGAASTAGAAGAQPNAAPDSGAGGGSGGGISTANASGNGGAGGGISSLVVGTPTGGIVAGASPVTLNQTTGSALPGAGGGGGAAGGQAGATGGRYGGGGGGGGASINGTASGAGGNGGPGYVRVVCY